jgi:nucleoside-diphosphate-sugar epimerase
MKIVLTGATGFVGSEVLLQLLEHPKVTQVTALVRRPLPQDHPKLRCILHTDFTRYDESLLGELSDHAGCIWAIGGKASDIPDPAEYERVTHTTTIAFAQALATHAKGHFNFCYLSGMGASPKENTWLSWERSTRHLKGRTERDLRRIQERHKNFSARSFRAGGIFPKGFKPDKWRHKMLSSLFITVDELARGMIAAVTNGRARGYRVISNRQIKRVARRAGATS